MSDTELRKAARELLDANKMQRCRMPPPEYVREAEDAVRAALAQIEPDLFWDADDPENTGSETLDHLVHLVADGLCPGDGVREIDVMTACRMPSIKVRAWVENDELMWERIDAAMAKACDGFEKQT